MYKLSADPSFHFELLRMIGHTAYNGADISECLVAAAEIVPGDFESWYAAWNRRAERILSQVGSLKNPISIRDSYFRAATYSRAADFFLHGNPDDPRVASLWKQQAACFDKAIALLENPGYRVTVQADGFTVPLIVFPAGKKGDATKRPTVILGNGYDGSMEEIYHMHGAAALERGYHVIVYEGPGQPTVRRDQGLGFIYEWEKVVSPIVDFLLTQPFVDSTKIGLMGYSLGGYLAARAAAFEPRLAACIQIDGVYDFGISDAFGSETTLAKYGDPHDEAAIQAIVKDPKTPTGLRWAFGHGLWAFNVKTRQQVLDTAKKFSLVGIIDNIKCPIFVGDAANEMFFAGQPKMVADLLGDRATLATFTDEDGAAEHCHMGAPRYSSQVMYEWFDEKVVKA
ncbi:alpha/beta-hydrolase [Hypomontagnella monticulosa]|nr:alpha/beta-hydrolase [Hypomontagnella monticulosa]